ncbi:hypothetical protein AB0A74_18065 [Saccharothrix sp. NPDC042600]|uniref:hypothetical protein n=1 Tax=Saccharothrix TaxID=2071 RepID=UPI0033EAF72B|nr:hypothetical protein GCM10017745_18510 [Saccharothrix mutabilis subsp. capreolus]
MTRKVVLPAWCGLLALVVLFPLLGRGFVLSYDMVFAPSQSLLPESVGAGSTPARSVPADAVVALVTGLLPGDVVQKVLLAAALFLGPWGSGRLVPTESLGTRLVAATAYGWTPYVAERLFMGHWPYLLAYACLPWIAAAGLAVRAGEPKSLARLVLWMAPAVLTPTGGLLAAGTALAACGRRRAGWVVAAAVGVNLPWLVPSVLRSGAVLSAPQAVELFAAKGENWAGVVVSVLGLGGYWNADVVPASRGLPLVPVLTVAVVAVALVAFPRLVRSWGVGLVALGGLGVVFALLAHLPFGRVALEWAVASVPGAALSRDAQKWVAWWALPLAVGFALGVEALARAHKAVVAVAVALPVVAMPDLAWGGWGRLDTVQYPADWARVRAVLADDPRSGDVLALPLGAFRRFEWNGDRTQLDPAPRVLPRTVVVDDTVHVSGVPVPGEDTRMPGVRAALRDGSLGAVGVGWVLVEHGTPGDVPDLSGLDEVFAGPWLTLYRVPGDVATPAPEGLGWIVAGDVVAVLILAGFVLWQRLPTGRLLFHRREE